MRSYHGVGPEAGEVMAVVQTAMLGGLPLRWSVPTDRAGRPNNASFKTRRGFGV
jgi:hypothetical protein